MKDSYHDFFEYKTFFKMMAGHRINKKTEKNFKRNKIYIASILGLFCYTLIMAVISIIVTSGDKIVMFQSLHLILLVLVTLTGLGSRVWTDGELEAAIRSLEGGVYPYEEEVGTEEHGFLKERCVEDIRRLAKFFSGFILVSCAFNVFCQPGIMYLMSDPDIGLSKPINPFLPQPMYMPFDTRTPFGFVVAYLIDTVFLVYVCSIVVCMDEFYTSLLMQIRVQLEILNHSLINIESRALGKMSNLIKENLDMRELYETQEFQNCMYSCLRSNILHYRAILSLEKNSRTYTGANFLFIITSAAVALATLSLLILENPGSLVFFGASLSGEMLFTYHYCLHGEYVTIESTKVYHTFYSTPWTSCNRRFNVMVSIMMELTRKPITIKPLVFDFTARLETFGDILSRVYQLINVMRGTL